MTKDLPNETSDQTGDLDTDLPPYPLDAEPELNLIRAFVVDAEEASARVQVAVDEAMHGVHELTLKYSRDPGAADPVPALIAIGALGEATRRLAGAVEGVEAHVRRLLVSVVGRREL